MILIYLLLLFILIIIIGSPLAWLLSKNKALSQIGRAFTIVMLFLIAMAVISNVFTTKMELKKNDIYGNYTIDRSKFSGKNSDWQYNHYRFKITKDDKIFFYITEKEKIVKTIKGTIIINDTYENARLKINFDEPKFHIFKENPTLYRNIWSFYYVFYSNKYNNMFFKKAVWKPID